MISGPKSPHAAISRPFPEDFFPEHRPPTHRNTANAPFSPATPISPPSGPAPRLFQEPPAKSKFLAAAESPNRFGFHWNCNAETHYLVGEGMGRAMVELLGGPKAPANPTGPAEKK